MRNRTFTLSEHDAGELQAAYLSCREAATKTRYQAVRLYGLGYATAQIRDICGCSRTSLLAWARAYRQGGLTALTDHRQGGNRARLTPSQIEAVQTQLHQYTPAQLRGGDGATSDGAFWTVDSVAQLLTRDYGVAYASPTSYRTLLMRCDFRYQRPAKQYKSHSEANIAACEAALEKKW